MSLLPKSFLNNLFFDQLLFLLIDTCLALAVAVSQVVCFANVVCEYMGMLLRQWSLKRKLVPTSGITESVVILKII